MKKLLLIIILTPYFAYSENVYLICDVQGRGFGWGPMYGQSNYKESINMSVLTTVQMELDKPTVITLSPQCNIDNSRLFSCSEINSIESRYRSDDQEIYFSKRFKQDISNWSQSVSLNRITLKIKVIASRKFIKPPDEGWSISYEGTCKKTDKQF